VPRVVCAAAAAATPAAKTSASGTVGENFIGVLRYEARQCVSSSRND
jgi:hypothetical protein